MRILFPLAEKKYQSIHLTGRMALLSERLQARSGFPGTASAMQMDMRFQGQLKGLEPM